MAGGRPRQFDREEVLQRAMEFFWAHGYEAASLPGLLGAMQISRQSLYDTFGNKRGLFINAIEHYRATQLSRALELLERDGSRVENVKSLVHYFEDLAADARCRGCLVANALVEVAPHDEGIAGLLHETLETLRGAVERVLHEAQQRGEISAAKSPVGLSRALINAMLGMAVTGKLPIRTEELRDVCAGTLSMLD